MARPQNLTLPGIEPQALAREQLDRIVDGAAEVMVKVRRGGQNDQHVQKHLAYITRDGRITAENERGERIDGRAALARLTLDWEAAPANPKPGMSRLFNLVLSMPAGTPPAAVKAAAREFARAHLARNHAYVFVLHTPEDDPDPEPPPHPHVHVSVLACGHDGRRLDPDKATLRSWREDFAARLRGLGVAAEATPRRLRGVVQRRTRSAEWHILRRGANSAAREARLAQIADEFRAGELELKPWEAQSCRAQARIRRQWTELAEHLRAAGRPEDIALATRIDRFVAAMPVAETERMARKRTLARLGGPR